MDLLAALSSDAAGVLARLPLSDRDRARRLLQSLGGRCGTPPEAVPLLETVVAALQDAPDAEMALLNLERWTGALPTPATTLSLLREDPRLLDDLLRLFGASQYLSDILIRDPWLYSLMLEDPSPRDMAHYRQVIDATVRPLRRAEGRREALRRIKRREFLRIGWRDLARRAPTLEVAREISDLADALVQGGLFLAREEVDPSFATASGAVRLSVIAMGKLGARELNYSSDIDLVFVMDSSDPHDDGQRRYATRLAETLIAVLAQETGEGRCFRVDMRLRPEGRFGALVRSFGAFRNYYDRWAETWERQALIKARAMAGDEELGERFMALIRPVIYRQGQGAALLEDVREMRAAVEAKLIAAGEMEDHVKEGRGTIRDVEFSIQLLQLLFGADHRELQVRDTATALDRLEAVGLLSPEERATFVAGYAFFRAVEHRLQILNDLPVRRLPSDPVELRRVARSMDYPDAEAFMAAYRRHSIGVRTLAEAIHERLGVRTESGDALREALLAADTPIGAASLEADLMRRAFPEVDEALKALVRLASGGPHSPHPSSTRRLFAELGPALLDACSAAADPTWAVEGMADLADRKLVHRAFYQTLQEHPEVLAAMCRFAGAAPDALRVVLRYPELSDLVTDLEHVSRRRTADEIRDDLQHRLRGVETYERRLSALRRFKLREFVRLAARHVVGPVEPEVETAEWSDIADELLRASLEIAVQHLREQGRWTAEDTSGFAVFALGRYGGRDLHFPSDLDLLYVFSEDAGLPQQSYEALARALGEVLQTVTEEGRLFELDLRLRPEGRQGFSVTALEAARRYYGEGGRAQTWEFQTLTRLRPVAGSASVAGQFGEIVRTRVYRTLMPSEWRDEIRAMKRRVEAERAGERDRPWHLKLGPGGLSDIEFLVQYLQLAHGGADPRLQPVTLLDGVAALRAAGHLADANAAALIRDYRFLTRLRQSLALMRGDEAADVLPVSQEQARRGRALARAVGLGDLKELQETYREQTAPVRELLLQTLGAGP